MKIVFFYSKDLLWGKLTKFFTKSYIYHVGFLSDDEETIYDMNFLPRAARFSSAKKKKALVLPITVSIPEIWLAKEICWMNGRVISEGNVFYGILDYLSFGIRWIYHLFGKSTPNFRGIICSEFVNDILKKRGIDLELKEVPSPTCLWNKYLEFLVETEILDEEQIVELNTIVGNEH